MSYCSAGISQHRELSALTFLHFCVQNILRVDVPHQVHAFLSQHQPLHAYMYSQLVIYLCIFIHVYIEMYEILFYIRNRVQFTIFEFTSDQLARDDAHDWYFSIMDGSQLCENVNESFGQVIEVLDRFRASGTFDIRMSLMAKFVFCDVFFLFLSFSVENWEENWPQDSKPFKRARRNDSWSSRVEFVYDTPRRFSWFSEIPLYRFRVYSQRWAPEFDVLASLRWCSRRPATLNPSCSLIY